MAVTASALLQQGTRVRIRRGASPLSPDLIGRTGVVVDSSEYHAHSYGVLLDDTQELLVFAPEELEVVTMPALLVADRQEAKKRSALP